METDDFVNFDEMFAQDVEEKGHEYQLFGVKGIIPPKIPMGVIIQYERNRHRKDEEAGLSLTVEMLESIFGADVVTEWSKNPKFNSDMMMEILQWGLGKYGLGKAQKTERGKAKLKVVKD